MKNIKLNSIFLFLILFNLSCGDSDNEIDEQPNNEITDDYKLVAVSDLGQVFEIGNNTGNIENIGQINKESNDTFLSTTTMTSSEEKIYSIEYIYNPLPTNNLLIFNKQNGTSEIIPLTIPSTINGDEKGIVALTWVDNSLIGVLVENLFINNSSKRLISINPQDYSISDLGITFNQDRITSIEKIDSKIYIATWGEGLVEIDLINNSVNNFSTINGSRIKRINNSELAIMELVTGNINGAKPKIIDLTTINISDALDGESYGLWTVSGNTIYENGIYYNLISSSNLNLFLGILKTDFETNENSIVEVNSTSVNPNLIIVDITD